MGRPKKEAPNHASGQYEIKATVGHDFRGNPIRKSFYSPISKADAKLKAEQFKIDKAIAEATGEIVQGLSPQFDIWARKVLSLIKGTVKDSTYNLTYKNSIENHLIPHFGKRKLDNIKPFHIQEYFNEKGLSYSKETLSKHKMALNRIFEHAVNNDMCRKSPLIKINITSKVKAVKKDVYTAEETTLILDYARNHRYGLAIVLMLGYGITRSEVLGLRWNDVDYQTGFLRIQRGVADSVNADTGVSEIVVGETKNEHRNREIPLSKDTISLIKKAPKTVVIGANKKKGILGKKIKTEYIIHNKHGTLCSPRTWDRRHYGVFMTEMIEHYAKKNINIQKLTSHSLRHTRATLWVNEGKNLYAIAKILGHADLEMLVKRYGHSNTDDLKTLLEIK